MIPEQARAVTEQLDALLGDVLVGVYLHGSFALGCGNPNCSDLDVLVVTRRSLTATEREAFLTLPRGTYERPGWPRPLELSALTEAGLHPWRHPSPYDFHLSPTAASGPGVDHDLAAHVTVARRAGIALAGPPPADLLPEVPRSDYVAALLRDFDDATPWRLGGVRYAVLSLPRVWASLAEPDVLHTKESGAVWALERLPAEHRRPLELALASYRTHGRDIATDRREFDAYAQAVAEEVRRIHPRRVRCAESAVGAQTAAQSSIRLVP